MSSALDAFHPVIRDWFLEAVGQPTDVQEQAWAAIAAGEHVLATAPTGSGKTLAAFLWALNQLLTGAWPEGAVQVVYVSPLKALNNDIQRNLLTPLQGIERAFRRAGERCPQLKVMTRSGDTPASERRQFLRRPPEIFITTPESLNILLASPKARTVFSGVKTVILDEIHAVAGTKRGTHLITAVDRLLLEGDGFQRVALSATVNPLEMVAAFVGGYRIVESREGVEYRPRPVRIIQGKTPRRYELEVRYPEASTERPDKETWWPWLVNDFLRIVRQNRATLLFTNTRRVCERIAYLMNEQAGGVVAYAHHGSLSRELRLVVEQRLKAGELAAIVATNSLELGIDIGSLDQVVLVETPHSAASAIQRVGRAGHQVGAASRGVLYPTHGRDFLQAAVMAAAVEAQDIEPIAPVRNPLDVLAQIILAMASVDEWEVDALYEFLRSTWPYHTLPRTQYERVLEMLAGRYADSRIRHLQPRLVWDRTENTISAGQGARMLLYSSGGTIPDHGYYSLVLMSSNARIGELDEEFVWERRVGDTFSLGAQSWTIHEITHNEVKVTPGQPGAAQAPFWRAEELDRGFHLSEKLAVFLAEADARLGEEAFREDLLHTRHMRPAAADALLAYLARQRAETGASLPHRHHLLEEHYQDPESNDDSRQIFLHTLWGGRLNRPYAYALAAAYEEAFGHPLEVFANNDAISLLLPADVEDFDPLALVTAQNLDGLLRKHLEKTGYFGARFRENAARALLLPKGRFNERMPLWLNRLRAKKLLAAVLRYPDFPVLTETWRTCLRDEFDLDTLRTLLDELHSGVIRRSIVHVREPSPFAEGLVWRQINQFMYMDDTPGGAQTSSLSERVLREALFSSELRPRLDPALVREFVEKLQRLRPDYAPQSPQELLEWLKERLYIPWEEWDALLAVSSADVDAIAAKALQVQVQPAREDARTPEEAPRAFPHQGGNTRGAEAQPAREDARPPEETPRAFPHRGENTRGVEGKPARGDACPPEETLRTFPHRGGNTRGVEDKPARADACPPEEKSKAFFDGVLALEHWPRFAAIFNVSPAAVQRLDGEASTLPKPRLREGDSLEAWLAEFLRYYGPLEKARLTQMLPADPDALHAAVDALVESETVVVDHLVEGATELQVCDAENLEILLRRSRRARRPQFQPLPLAQLPLFLASMQGLGKQHEGEEGLRQALESLFGWRAPVDLWETDLLPARMRNYDPHLLDSLMQRTRLMWLGHGKQRIAPALAEDVELFKEPHDEAAEEEFSLPDAGGQYRFVEMLTAEDASSAAVTGKLWEAVWQGQISNTSFEAFRQAARHGFKPAPLPAVRARGRRSFSRWQSSRPFAGHWFTLPQPEPPEDRLDAIEREKDRVRVLLERYGILFRELLQREAPLLRWGKVFPALRLMELSGEILSGVFFDALPGLQFTSHEGLRRLRQGLDQKQLFWLNAADPASLCGLGLEGLDALPRRLKSSHLVYRGDRLLLIATRGGKDVQVFASPDDPNADAALALFRHMLTRRVAPETSISLERINGDPAPTSPYLPLLRRHYDVTAGTKKVELWRKSGAG